MLETKTGTHHFQPASLPLVYEHSVVRSRWVVEMREDQDEVFTYDLNANGWSLKERGGDGDSGFSREGVWFARRELEENEAYLVRLWACSTYQRPINLSKHASFEKRRKTHVVTTTSKSCSYTDNPMSMMWRSTLIVFQTLFSSGELGSWT